MIYRSEPPDFRPQFSTVACKIYYNNDVLLLRRSPKNTFGGFLGLPGGKMEGNEIGRIAVAREVYEETGIDKRNSLGLFQYHGVRWVRFKNHLDFTYHHFSLELPYQPSIRLSTREHSEFLWIPSSELREYAAQMVEDVFETLIMDWK